MEDELDFSQTLTKMAELAKQMELLNMIRAILKFIQANQNLYFGDLLQALARYTSLEYAKEDGNPDWDVIGSLLRQAASKVDSRCDCQVRSISLEIEIEEQFTKYSRHSKLSQYGYGLG